MIYVIGGLALAITYTLVALGIAIWQANVSIFGDIALACNATLTPLGQCRLDAIAAGWQTLAGLSLAALILLATLLLEQSKSKQVRPALPPGVFSRSLLYRAFLIGVVLLLIGHFVARLTEPFQAERLAMLAEEGRFTSLENLVWPLLLQLYVSERSRIARYLSLALILVIASLTFYRAMLLGVLVFGVGLYALEIFWHMACKRRHWRRLLPILTERILVGLAVTVVFVSAVKADSANRKTFVNAVAQEQAQNDTGGIPNANLHLGLRRVLQRITFPLYQASLAEKMAATNELPNLQTGLARKFHLSDKPNLNEYLYRALYSFHPVGQTTSLTYGEAAAWSSAPPLVWVATAMLLLGLLALVGRKWGVPIGVLVGLAIWRGFSGGVIDILPSLALQLIGVILITKTTSLRQKRL